MLLGHSVRRIFLTGGSGFIGSHTILQLLAAGHEVRTTVRNLAREGEVRAFTIVAFAAPGVPVPFVAAVIDCGGTSVRGNIIKALVIDEVGASALLAAPPVAALKTPRKKTRQ